MKKSNAGAQPAMAENVIAAVWGVAEGTVFFIVPDVWISWVALKSRRRSLTTTLSALAGALVGGLATYKYSSRTGADATRRFLVGQPAISHAMINRIEHEMVEEGPKTLMRGPLRGAPYKIYARTAGVQEQPLGTFLAWSVPARLIRFVLVSLGSSAMASATKKHFPRHAKTINRIGFFAAWTAFYIWFFKTTGRED